MSTTFTELFPADLAMDAASAAFLDAYLAEVARTRAGHWHPDVVACGASCPAWEGNPRCRAIHLAVLAGAR